VDEEDEPWDASELDDRKVEDEEVEEDDDDDEDEDSEEAVNVEEEVP